MGAYDPYVKASPVLLGNSLSVIAGADCIVTYLAFANTDSSDRTVTVEDGNGKSFLPGINVTTATLEVIPIPEGGLYFPGGVKWMASVSSKVVAWIKFQPMQ